MKIKTSS